MMTKLIKALVLLSIMGFIGLSAFAWFGDISPTPSDKSLTVILDAD